MNDNEKYIQEFVKDLPFDAPHPKHRDELKKELLTAFPRHRLQPTAQTVGVWRTIMKSRITRLAAAAVIVLAAILALNFFNETSGIVWADVVQRLEGIKTVSYKIAADIKGMPGAPEGYTTHTTQNVTVSYEQCAVRIDSMLQTPGGTRKSQTYILFEDSAAITVIPDQKKYFKVTISDEQMQKMGAENGDPVTLLKAMLEHKYIELGRKTIDDIAARGIQVSDPKLGTKMGSFISGGMFDETTVQLWVDQKHELPIRIYATGSSKDGRSSMEMVYDNFQWDIKIEPARLKPEIPGDYELVAQGKWETGKEGEEIIEVLRLFVEFADGKYPPSLKTMTVANAIAPAIKKKFSADSGKPSKELIARLMKVDMVGLMYTTLERNGKDPAYYGDRVSAESPQAVLFRWKIAGDTYRVVFGDLRTEDVSADKLVQLEAAPLNPQSKAIRPKPADGLIGTQIDGLELSWMPGTNATGHKVYMGTSPDALNLLAEVSGSASTAAPALERGATYYWRIDEVQSDGSVVTGDVWKFSPGRLVGWWKFDEGSGVTATDSSGNNLHGTIAGDPTWVDCPAGKAMQFDGDGDYVDLGNDSSINITSQITVAAWIKVDMFDCEWQAIITNGDGSWRLQRNGTKDSIEFACTGAFVPGALVGSLFGTVGVNDGRWHHIAGTFDGSKICLFVDGRIDVAAKTDGVVNVNNYNVFIGANAEKTGRNFKGSIDDVRIYSYALSIEEVKAIFAEQSPGPKK